MQQGSSAASNEADQRFAGQIKADKLRLLYQQSFQAVFFSLAGALLLTVILWPHTAQGILIGWLTALVIASAARLILFVAYRRAAPRGTAMLAWERPYLVTLMLSSLVWGLGGVWIMPPDSLLYQVVVCYFLMGMAGGAISVYSAIRPFAIATITVVLLPATLWLLSRGELTPLVMGLATPLVIVSSIRASRVLSSTLNENFRLSHQLQESMEAAERLARTDTLTGLNNRRAFTELAEAAIRLCGRQAQPVSAIVMDLDHFKQINDSQGHLVGDNALQHVARLLQATVRKTDICARSGGEEFAVLLPNTSREAAMGVAEKIRKTIAGQPVPAPAGPLLVTASLGVACGDGDLESLLRLADAAMYRAKAAGRNRVVADHGPAAERNVGIAP